MLRSRAHTCAESTGFSFLADGRNPLESLTFSELDRAARAIAAGLSSHRAEGERCLILLPQGLDYIKAFFGCLYAGVIAVPAAPPGATRDAGRLERILLDCEPKFAFVSKADRIDQAAAQPNAPVRLSISDFDGAEAGWVLPQISAGSLAYLQYTSGSTADPKGVKVSHANVLHNLAGIDAGFRHDADSRSVTWLPFYHDMGLVYGMLQPVYNGFPAFVMAPVSFVQRPVRWLQAISAFRATHSGAPNFAYDLCVDQISAEERAALDLSNWAVAFNGAEPVRERTLERFAAAFAPSGFRKSAFYPAYGLAEATLKVSGGVRDEGVHVLSHSSGTQSAISCGRVIADTVVAIVNPETGVECPAGTSGEIWVSGPSVSSGYWNRPDETSEKFAATLHSHPGKLFLRTGDIGILSDGELLITGRLKGMIIVRGVNYYAEDLEEAVYQLTGQPRSLALAVFGFTEAEIERVAIVVEVNPRDRKNLRQLAQQIRQTTYEQHLLHAHSVIFVRRGKILKTSSGKVRRAATRDLYLSGELDLLSESIVEESLDHNDGVPPATLLADRQALAPTSRRAALVDRLAAIVSQIIKRPVGPENARQPLVILG
ncbi:MAG TPA: fatty acyl-AMP ligase, partial [Candidatus Angelobacter sp.]|nr:fatty acyl-AMP ligase [Candidatus Angelobacter sp.]